MKVVDLDQTIFVPVVDETHGEAVVEMKMTVGEFFGKFCQGFEPKTIDAIPVEWLEQLQTKMVRDMYSESIVGAVDVIIWEWEKEQEAQDI